MSWIKRELSVSESAKGLMGIIQSEFEKIFMSSSARNNMGMFSIDDTIYIQTNSHPACEIISRTYNFKASNPSPKNCVLLVGVVDAKEKLIG